MAFRSVYKVKSHSYVNKKGKRVTVKAHTATRTSARSYNMAGTGPLSTRARKSAMAKPRRKATSTYATRKGIGRRTAPAAPTAARRRASSARVSSPFVHSINAERYVGARGNIKKMTQKHYVANRIKARSRRLARPTIPVSVRFRKR